MPVTNLTTFRVQRAVRGDAESLAWVFERLQPAVLAYARHRLASYPNCHESAEDLAQHAWLVALDALPRLKPRSGRITPVLMTYLSRTVLNRVRELHRSAGRAARGAQAIEAEGANRVAPPPEEGSQVQRLLCQEQGTHALEALQTLTPADREIVMAVLFEERTQSQVAQRLQLDKSTISRRLSLAIERLRAAVPTSLFDDYPEFSS